MSITLDPSAGITYPAGGNPQAAEAVVIQVVNVTTGSFTTTSTSPVNTGLSATITPKFATSKILAMVNISTAVVYAAGMALQWNLLRNGSQICVVDYGILLNTSLSELDAGTISRDYLDSPATTSALTYTTQAFVRYGSGNGGCGNTQTLTLMEIAQ
jgi:uncharacterized protein YaiE (UPF0345 family)